MDARGIVAAEAAVATLLRALGVDHADEAYRDTPRRVVSALLEMTGGRDEDAEAVLSVRFDAGEYDESVAVAGIPFTSVCQHHLLPFVGRAGVAYLPARDVGHGDAYRVVGLSKLARVVDVYARRLQIQERMTSEIANAIEVHLKPRGVAVLIEAEHTCMACRGVRKTGAVMRTCVVRGVYREKPEARAEVLELLRWPA
jgi:GTP cyclohydrolase I